MAHSIEELAEAALLEMDEATRQWAAEVAELLGSVSRRPSEGLASSVVVPLDLVNELLAQAGCARTGVVAYRLIDGVPSCMWCELADLAAGRCRRHQAVELLGGDGE